MLYLIGIGLYFGRPLLNTSTDLLTIAGLVLLLTLPVVLLFLLWRALRHLNKLNLQNARFTRAAELLVSPDGEALTRIKSLAAGIQSEITKVNNSFDGTVDALKDVQLAMTRESQALDAAGLKLTNRSEDVGRNLTLQRQALESISGTFDTRMETLSTQISDTSQTFDSICTTAEEKLLKAGEALQLASGKVDQALADSSNRISEKITEIDDVSRKLDETSTALNENLEASVQTLTETDQALLEKTQALQELNTNTQTKLIDLQNTIDDGKQMLVKLQEAAETRDSFVQSYYKDLSAGLKQSENETLAAQGKTTRMVESNLAQMRHDFTSMEADLQALQSKLESLKSTPIETAPQQIQQARLKLEPLDSDFPPVEAPRFTPESKLEAPKVTPPPSAPLNLGMDMEIESPNTEILGFEPNAIVPDVIRRPGDPGAPSKTSTPIKKGFGRRTEKQDKSGWRWRDMLGTLDRPDTSRNAATALVGSAAGASLAASSSLRSQEEIDGAGILTMLKLSPSAIVDEGTVIDATQAQINAGQSGLVSTVAEKLPEAISHLKHKMSVNPQLIGNLRRFSDDYAAFIGNTPPTAPALRTVLGSPDGRAYLLAVTALKG